MSEFYECLDCGNVNANPCPCGGYVTKNYDSGDDPYFKPPEDDE